MPCLSTRVAGSGFAPALHEISIHHLNQSADYGTHLPMCRRKNRSHGFEQQPGALTKDRIRVGEMTDHLFSTMVRLQPGAEGAPPLPALRPLFVSPLSYVLERS